MNYIEQLLILAPAVSGCVSVFVVSSLVNIPKGITSSATEFKICVITAGIKRGKLIIKKKKNRVCKIVLLAKTKLNAKEVSVSKALID